jgi:predicted transcriptional regulator
MAQIESKHDVRRKVRDAQAQVNRERLKRESDNREDMVAFLVAEQKLSAVSEWEAERHAQVRQEAEQRRAEQRLEGARALARMRDRGETVADIAQLGGCSVKLVRRYLKEELQAAAPVSGTALGNGSRALGFDGAAVASDVSQVLGGGGEDTKVEVESSTAAAGVGGHP